MLLEIQSDGGGVIRASRMSWSMVLWLARDGGWAGAERFIVDGHAAWPEAGAPGWRLDAAEAAVLAAALEAALPDVPDHDAMLHKVAWTIDFPDWSGVQDRAGRPGPRGQPVRFEPERHRLRYLRPGERVGPFEYFSGPNKDRLRKLIELSRHGGLNIRPGPGDRSDSV